jgi:hypothetical protein
MAEKALPFPRGKTMGDGQLSLDDDTHKGLEGKVYQVPDTIHGTGQPVFLRVVKNDTGAAITIARKLCEFDGTDEYDFGRRITSFGNNISGHGVVCKPIDDAYTAGNTIPDDDLFYVVEAGYCDVVTESGAVSLPRGTAVTANSTGTIDGARAAAGNYVIGTAVQPMYTASTNVTINVNPGLLNASA